jgi:hypothetical protein
MVQSRVQYGPHWEPTGALLQRSQRAQSCIVHAKPDCPLHRVREALSPLAIHRAQHTASWLLPPLVLRPESSIRVAPSHPSSARAITAMFCQMASCHLSGCIWIIRAANLGRFLKSWTATIVPLSSRGPGHILSSNNKGRDRTQQTTCRRALIRIGLMDDWPPDKRSNLTSTAHWLN